MIILYMQNNSRFQFVLSGAVGNGECCEEGEDWHIPNSKQYNQYEKYHLISFQKVCHYLKKNLYRDNTLIKIHKVLTYLAMPLTDRLFFYLSPLLISLSHGNGLFLNVVNRKMMSIWFLYLLFVLFFVNHIIHVMYLKPLDCLFLFPLSFLFCVHMSHPHTHEHTRTKSWHTALTGPLDCHMQINRCDTKYVIAPLFK